VDAAEKAVIDLDVKDQPLHEVVRLIEKSSGASIVLGENRDGRPLADDDTLRVTLKLDDVSWKTALKLAVEKAGAQLERLSGGAWRVYQPPRYVLSLMDAEVGVVVTTVARLGDLNVVFNADLLRGRKVTLRLSNLPWMKSLEVVVNAAGLVLVPDRDGAKHRIRPRGKSVSKEPAKDSGSVEADEGETKPSKPPARTAETPRPSLHVSCILRRTDGGRNLAVVNGHTVLQGEIVPGTARPKASPPFPPVKLEKVVSDRLVWFHVNGKRVPVSVGKATETSGK
jgi:hypothetical protein